MLGFSSTQITSAFSGGSRYKPTMSAALAANSLSVLTHQERCRCKQIPCRRRTRGYDRIVGALANLGYKLSDQTVGNILHRYGIPPAPKRKPPTSWGDFIRAHLAVLVGTDFF